VGPTHADRNRLLENEGRMKNELPASHSGVTAKLTRSSQQSKTPMGNPALACVSKRGAIHG
jgi:hypothetical protein